MFLQLNPPIPLKTPKGKAWAVAMIDYGPQWDLQWITFLHDSGECWTFQNRDIRQEENYTFGIKAPSDIKPSTQRPTFPIDGEPTFEEHHAATNGHAQAKEYLPYLSKN